MFLIELFLKVRMKKIMSEVVWKKPQNIRHIFILHQEC